MKARAYLASIGQPAPTRGRLSSANHAILKEAIEAGVELSDYPPNKVEEDLIPELTFRFSEKFYVAREKETGRIRSMREACSNCLYSLTSHICDNPSIVSFDGTCSVEVEIIGK